VGTVSRFEKFLPSAFHPMAAGAKTSKKRAAPSQIGPRSKKIHSEKPATKDEKPSVVKRSRPVTLPQTHGSDTSSDEGGENSSEEDDGELEDEDEKMPDAPTKDPNGRCRFNILGRMKYRWREPPSCKGSAQGTENSLGPAQGFETPRSIAPGRETCMESRPEKEHWLRAEETHHRSHEHRPWSRQGYRLQTRCQ
jgi:hypothetical protein